MHACMDTVRVTNDSCPSGSVDDLILVGRAHHFEDVVLVHGAIDFVARLAEHLEFSKKSVP